MLDMTLKNKFDIINNGSLFINNLAAYKNDEFVKLFKDKKKYEEFLNDLADNSKPTLKKMYKKSKEYLINNIVCISSINSQFHTLYGFSDNFGIAYIDNQKNKSDKLRHILAAAFVNEIARNVRNDKIQFLIPLGSLVMTKFITKSLVGPIDINEAYPETLRIISAWYLKLFNNLTLGNLDKVLMSNNVSFVSSSETQELLNSIKNIKSSIDLFNYIGNKFKVNGNSVIINFTNRYSIDMILSIESLLVFSYMVTSANIFLFPSNLYFGLSQLHNGSLNSFTKEMYKKVVKNILK